MMMMMMMMVVVVVVVMTQRVPSVARVAAPRALLEAAGISF